jgi:hypothetical protein
MVAMWEHYKKTFGSMQFAIAVASISIFYGLGHRLDTTAVFFLMMQGGAVLGAAWAKRLRRKILQAP